MGNEPDMSEPLKGTASKTGEKRPKEQSNSFLSAFVSKNPAVIEKRARAHFTREGRRGGRGGAERRKGRGRGALALFLCTC